MTREELTKMAAASGLVYEAVAIGSAPGFVERDVVIMAPQMRHSVSGDLDALQRFAERVEAAAREACAKRCENIYAWGGAYYAGPISSSTTDACAAAIRAMGKP